MQQQQQANYDLLAVFNNDSDADAAEAKLRKEQFADDEIFRLAGASLTEGQFREHGPSRDRDALFLQTTRSGPNPITVILLAVLFGVILAGVLFAIADFAIAAHPVIPATIAGAVVGLILGAILGLSRRGPVRGAIGQDVSRVSTPAPRPDQAARNVIAVRLHDPDNISRKSKARAILINNKGKIDRSVGR